jgi:MGT family glycosyltransferase
MERATLVLHATDQKFDFDFRDLPPRHRYVGPLLWNQPTPTPEYLGDPGPPWVLVALSSDPQDDLAIARGALAALESRPVRVLVTIGDAHDARELAPVPANARVERYVPHDAVLDQAILLIGHAGHGSVMKALCKGVPMLLVPWDRDQPGVAARAERLGVAVVVRRADLSVEAIGHGINKMLEDSNFRVRAAAEAHRLQGQDPATLACQFIEQV